MEDFFEYVYKVSNHFHLSPGIEIFFYIVNINVLTW
jgi:hypothetical protein